MRSAWSSLTTSFVEHRGQLEFIGLSRSHEIPSDRPKCSLAQEQLVVYPPYDLANCRAYKELYLGHDHSHRTLGYC